MTISDTACLLAVYFGVFSGIGLVLCLLEILFEKCPTLLRFACCAIPTKMDTEKLQKTE